MPKTIELAGCPEAVRFIQDLESLSNPIPESLSLPTYSECEECLESAGYIYRCATVAGIVFDNRRDGLVAFVNKKATRAGWRVEFRRAAQ